ncbi:MAG: 60 kDa chaperonin 1 [Alphaproteobacteria bacterium MarineAlpha11_Bin1]|nr:MAG: 60 kDa chaperonin 1 [Alphaproteobacteria bacterium MarineAlpha11_Bin1]|tara:strand:+ start:87 stop:1763 length:1677 start_codon:yes stop_codon:yes gene_type:complete
MATVAIKFGLEAQREMLRGINLLTRTVAATLGPKGRNVLIESEGGIGPPRITKDGVTVSDSLQVDGQYDQIGLRLIRRAGQRVGEEFGDGTTTTIVLAGVLASEGLKAVTAGYDPMELRLALNDGVNTIIDELRQLAQPVGGRSDLERIATVSANGDGNLGSIIAAAFDSVGVDGVVTVEGGEGFYTTWEKLNGLQWEGGYVSPYFMTDTTTTECRYEKPLILLTEHTLEQHTQLLKLLEVSVRENRPLLIVAEAVKGEALQTLTVNKIKNNLRVVAGKGPFFGDRRRETMEDLALLTGATLVSESRGTNKSTIDPGVLGTADRVILNKDTTTIIGAAGDSRDVARRANSVRAEQGAKRNTPFQEKILRERLARLTGGVVVVRIGGASEIEIKERRERADDAVSAVRAAPLEGILPGGGAGYIHATRRLTNDDTELGSVAVGILRRVLASPAERIAFNAGYDGRMISAKLAGFMDPCQGFDAQEGEFRDLFKAGIVDPARIAIAALEAANSVASLFLTAAAVISKPLPERPTSSGNIPFGPEAKDMTSEEAGHFGLLS